MRCALCISAGLHWEWVNISICFQPLFICPSFLNDRWGQVEGLTNDAHKQQFLSELFVTIREYNECFQIQWSAACLAVNHCNKISLDFFRDALATQDYRSPQCPWFACQHVWLTVYKFLVCIKSMWHKAKNKKVY